MSVSRMLSHLTDLLILTLLLLVGGMSATSYSIGSRRSVAKEQFLRPILKTVPTASTVHACWTHLLPTGRDINLHPAILLLDGAQLRKWLEGPRSVLSHQITASIQACVRGEVRPQECVMSKAEQSTLLDAVRQPPATPRHLLHKPSWTIKQYQDAATELAAMSRLDVAFQYLEMATSVQPANKAEGYSLRIRLLRVLLYLLDASPPYPVASQTNTITKMLKRALKEVPALLSPQAPKDIIAMALDHLQALQTRCSIRGLQCPLGVMKPLMDSKLPSWPWKGDIMKAPPPRDSSVTPSELQHLKQAADRAPCDIARRSWPELTKEAFEAEYSRPGIPVIVSNLTSNWPAHSWTSPKESQQLHLRLGQLAIRGLMRWTYGLEALPAHKNVRPLVLNQLGAPTTGERTANSYLQMGDAPDDNTIPRHVFRAGYHHPPIFNKSMLEACGTPMGPMDLQKQEERYDHKWTLVSAAGSGSMWHVDPLNTSAWNALLRGRKWWALYPPSSGGPPAQASVQTPAVFFKTVLPHFMGTPMQPVQCLLEEGETIFVPSGWFHSVVNLSPTVAVTENVMDRANSVVVMAELEAFRDHGMPIFMAEGDELIRQRSCGQEIQAMGTAESNYARRCNKGDVLRATQCAATLAKRFGVASTSEAYGHATAGMH